MRVDNHDVVFSLNNECIAHRINVAGPCGKVYSVSNLVKTMSIGGDNFLRIANDR